MNLPIPQVGYSSHGRWSTLGRIRELELDRGNDIPEFLSTLPEDTPAIWICLTRRRALRYAVPADDWPRVDDEDAALTEDEAARLSEMVEIPLEGLRIVHADPDGGFLMTDPRVKPRAREMDG